MKKRWFKNQYNSLSIFYCLIILFLAAFCVDQTINQKKEPSRYSQVIEIQETEKLKKDYIPGQILVKFRDGTDKQAINTVQKELHLETIKIISKPNLYLMEITDGTSVKEIMDRLSKYKQVKYSEPNFTVTIN